MNDVVLDIKELSYSYDGKKFILKNINFFIREGEVVKLSGPNGVGKSTFLNIVSGLIDDSNLEYTAEFQNEEIIFENMRSRISFVLDTPELFDQLTGSENIKMYSLLFECDDAYFDRVLDWCNKYRIIDFLSRPVEEYSLGTRHKLFLAILISRKVDLILLDEPFNALDDSSRKYLVGHINSCRDSSFIIVSHLNQPGLKLDRDFEMKLY